MGGIHSSTFRVSDYDLIKLWDPRSFPARHTHFLTVRGDSAILNRPAARNSVLAAYGELCVYILCLRGGHTQYSTIVCLDHTRSRLSGSITYFSFPSLPLLL